ncbi:MAG: dephospho-CoA kinase [Firmicutes bacterium]|nr:dephospho-CoA kinase [Bacillota bacterium]
MIVGITGGIATGKSTVTALLAQKGAYLIDTDVLAREIVEPGQAAYQKILQHFGRDILLHDGQINRKKLGNMVFNDQEKRKLLEQITHPEIRRLMYKHLQTAKRQGVPIVVVEIPLLFETDFYKDVDLTVVVAAAAEQQLSRLMAREDLSKEQAQKRLAAQMPLEKKIKLADFVIDNGGTIAETKRQVEKLWQRLLQESVNDQDY